MSARDQGAQALKNGDPQAAVQHLSQAVRENPQDPQSHAYLGTAYGQLQQFDKAAESLRQAAALAPQSAPIRFNLGVALEKAGKREDAVRTYQEVAALDPGHERAKQALARLGGGAVAAPAAPAPAPAAPSPAAAPAPAPAAAASVLDEFALGPAPAAPSGYTPPPAADPSSPLAAPPPAYGGPPPTASPYGAPPPGASPYGAPPPAAPGYAAAAPVPPSFGPPGGMVPLGDWTPPPGTPAPQPAWTPAPPPMPQAPPSHVAGGGPLLTSVDNMEEGTDRKTFLGECYITGMGMGFWWGLIGAIIIFLTAMTNFTSSETGNAMPRVLVMCAMMLAGGTLFLGLIGLIGGTTDDPEKYCGIMGIGLGLLTGGAIMPLVFSTMGAIGVGGLFGTVWVSWKMATAVGGSINEKRASVFVVAGVGGVAVTRGAR